MLTNAWMDNEDVKYCSTIKKEWNFATCDHMDGPKGCYTDENKSEENIPVCNFTYLWNVTKQE